MSDEKNGRQQAIEQANALATLLVSPGWRVFAEQCDRVVEQSYQAMIGAADGHSAAKHMGAQHAVRQLRDWPTRQFEALQMYLKNT